MGRIFVRCHGIQTFHPTNSGTMGPSLQQASIWLATRIYLFTLRLDEVIADVVP